MEHEGTQIAEWLNSFGVTAFVLKYRMHGTGHMHPVPMMDGQRAIRTVRARASEWNIDPARVGVMGFSAGGHLASTLGTHFDAGDANSARSDRARQLAARFLDSVLPGDFVDGRLHAPRFARQLAGQNAGPDAGAQPVQRNASDRRKRRPRSSSRRPKIRACRRRIASRSIWRCTRRACRRRCTSSNPAGTASGWPRMCRARSSGPSCATNGSKYAAC